VVPHHQRLSLSVVFVDWPSAVWQRMRDAETGTRLALVLSELAILGISAGLGALIAVAVGKPSGQGLWVGVVVGALIAVVTITYILIVGIAVSGSPRDEIFGGYSGNAEVDRLLRAERREAKRRDRDQGTDNR
jgi:hypothetical protein